MTESIVSHPACQAVGIGSGKPFIVGSSNPFGAITPVERCTTTDFAAATKLVGIPSVDTGFTAGEASVDIVGFVVPSLADHFGRFKLAFNFASSPLVVVHSLTAPGPLIESSSSSC